MRAVFSVRGLGWVFTGIAFAAVSNCLFGVGNSLAAVAGIPACGGDLHISASPEIGKRVYYGNVPSGEAGDGEDASELPSDGGAVEIRVNNDDGASNGADLPSVGTTADLSTDKGQEAIDFDLPSKEDHLQLDNPLSGVSDSDTTVEDHFEVQSEAQSPDWTSGYISASFSAPPGSRYSLTTDTGYPLYFTCTVSPGLLADGGNEPQLGGVGGTVETDKGAHAIICKVFSDLVSSGTPDSYNLTLKVTVPPGAMCGGKALSKALEFTAVQPQQAVERPTVRPYSTLLAPGEYRFETTDRKARVSDYQTPQAAFTASRTRVNFGDGQRVLGKEIFTLNERVDLTSWVWSRGYNRDGSIACQPTGANVRFTSNENDVTRLVGPIEPSGRPSVVGTSTLEYVVFTTLSDDGRELPMFPDSPNQQAALNAFSNNIWWHEVGHRKHWERGLMPELVATYQRWTPNRIFTFLRNRYQFDGTTFRLPPDARGPLKRRQEAGGEVDPEALVREADNLCASTVQGAVRDGLAWARGSWRDAYNGGDVSQGLKAEAPNKRDSLWGYWQWWTIKWDDRQRRFHVCFYPREAPAPTANLRPFNGNCFSDTLDGYVAPFTTIGVYGSWWPYFTDNGQSNEILSGQYVSSANGWLIARRP